MAEILKTLGVVLEALAKGWTLSLAAAGAAAFLLFAPESALPYLSRARTEHGGWFPIVLAFGTLHFATFALREASGAVVKVGRKPLREWLELRKLDGLMAGQRRALAPVLEGKQQLLARSTDPDIRDLQKRGVLKLCGAYNRVGYEGTTIFEVRDWAYERIKQNPALLDVAE